LDDVFLVISFINTNSAIRKIKVKTWLIGKKHLIPLSLNLVTMSVCPGKARLPMTLS
jgi:hypothetical protein